MAQGYDSNTEVEGRLREAVMTGRLVDLRTGDARADDSAIGGDWNEGRTVSGDFLADLVSKGEEASRPRAVRLAGARITGTLDLWAIKLACPMEFEGCWFENPCRLEEAIVPSFRLSGCYIPGLDAQQLTTHHNLELRDKCTVDGITNLFGAHIGGVLLLSGSTLINRGETALFADNLTVHGSMLARKGFTAHGEIRLRGAHIGSDLDFEGATLDNPQGYALRADSITIGQNLFCRGKLTARGGIRLINARISGALDFGEAELTIPDKMALDLDQVQANVLFLVSFAKPPSAIDLSACRVGSLVDERNSWPPLIQLRGFSYEALYERQPVSAHQRLDWLTRNDYGYAPQPYEQLVSVYRRAGRDQDARTIAIAKQRAQRRALGNERGLRRIGAFPSQAWNLLLDILVGYGYRAWLAVLWLIGFVLLGWWLFDRAHDAHLLVAAKPPGQRPWFYAAVYAIDLLLPFADLGYQGSWIADGWARPWYLVWTLVGWVLITAIVAALSGLIKRD